MGSLLRHVDHHTVAGRQHPTGTTIRRTPVRPLSACNFCSVSSLDDTLYHENMVDRRLLQEAQGLDDVDKLELAQELLSSVQFDALPVTPEEAALVEKRLAAQSANPDDKISSAEVWDRIKRQYQ